MSSFNPLGLFSYSYQINARTELAIRYNDKSPLENHHCAVAFEILDKVRMIIVLADGYSYC